MDLGNQIHMQSYHIIQLWIQNYILYLSRIVPEKGLIYLIEAFKKLDTDKKLVIAGGISDTEDYAKAVKELAGDDDRIIFTGFVQGVTRKELYDS